MRLYLIAVGTRMPAWVEDGFADYAKRLPPHLRPNLIEIAAGRRTKGADLERVVREEGERVLAATPADARVIALERTGRTLSTEQVAATLTRAQQDGNDLAFWIGGPEGLSVTCLQRAHEKWSLSALTLAHPVVRVVWAEQLYRAYSIQQQLPYHR
ncbi:MAG: 23S rRNA (pseudouridine(1915)-N(3))-methyltransferase RlmH [Gammaproteobacteria bacterium]